MQLMQTVIRILLVLSMILSSVEFAFCAQTGSTGWPIFRQVESARPEATNSPAYFPGDLITALSNPALLADLKSSEINAITYSGFMDARFSGIGYVHKFDNKSALGLSIFNYDYGQIALDWIEGNNIVERNVSAETDNLCIVSYGRALSSNLDGGINLKFATSKLVDQYSANAYAVDGGLAYHLGHNTVLSMALQNFGTASAFVSKNESLPLCVTPGISYLKKINSFYLLGGVQIPYLIEESRNTPGVAFEFGRWPVSFFADYTMNKDELAYKYGLSFATEKFDITYSCSPGQWLDNVNRISISMKLDNPKDIRTSLIDDYNKQQAADLEKQKKIRESIRTDLIQELSKNDAVVQPVVVAHNAAGETNMGAVVKEAPHNPSSAAIAEPALNRPSDFEKQKAEWKSKLEDKKNAAAIEWTLGAIGSIGGLVMYVNGYSVNQSAANLPGVTRSGNTVIAPNAATQAEAQQRIDNGLNQMVAGLVVVVVGACFCWLGSSTSTEARRLEREGKKKGFTFNFSDTAAKLAYNCNF